MSQQQGQNVMRRYVVSCLKIWAPVMAWFTQLSKYEEKRKQILPWKISEIIILDSPFTGVTRVVNVKGLFVERCRARIGVFQFKAS